MNIKCINLHSLKLRSLLVSIAVPLLTGALSNLLSGRIKPVYLSMEKPSFAPPPWVFPVVWSILFVLMGISCYLIYESVSPLRKKALYAYGTQLFLNMFWTLIFFRLGLYLFAAVWLGLIMTAAAVMLIYFYKINKCAAYLQIPYMLWLVFALLLNACVYFLN